MKRLILVTLLLSTFTSIRYLYAQDNTSCKVLKSEISEHYEGSCKKGKAHGKGKATGIDIYEGEFKKGLPHGHGIYIYSNGDIYSGDFNNGLRHGYGILTSSNGDKFEGAFLFDVKNGRGKLTKNDGKVISGTWYKDKFKDSTLINTTANYKITSRKNVKRVSISKLPTASNDKVEVVFKRDGRLYNQMNDLRLIGSSGTIITSMTYTAFETPVFPFKGKIEYIAPDEIYRDHYFCYLEFEINQSGSWLIELYF